MVRSRQANRNHRYNYATAKSQGYVRRSKIYRRASIRIERWRLRVTITLRKEGQKKGTEIGYIIAWVMDKSATPPKGKPHWISELLEADTADEPGCDPDQTKSLREMIRRLFTKAGTPRKKGDLSDRWAQLDVEKIAFLDTVKIHDKYRGTGVAPLALASLHRILAKGLEVSTAVLSPAGLDDADWGGLSEADIEKKLIRFYEKSGYEDWASGDDDSNGQIAVMGQTLKE